MSVERGRRTLVAVALIGFVVGIGVSMRFDLRWYQSTIASPMRR